MLLRLEDLPARLRGRPQPTASLAATGGTSDKAEGEVVRQVRSVH
jgi:hypothetical protein